MTDHLSKLESKSVHILREAYAAFGNLCMLWSIGKDSTVLLWLARKAFYGHVPFPLVHIDTHHKIPEMIEYVYWCRSFLFGHTFSSRLSRSVQFSHSVVANSL